MKNLFYIAIAISLGVFSAACEEEIVSQFEALEFSRLALEQYAARICLSKIESISEKSVNIDNYIDSRSFYIIYQIIKFADGDKISVRVEVPLARYGNKTNSAEVGGEIFGCRRR